MLKKTGIIIGVIFLIPILTYLLLILGNQIVLGIYVGIHHIKLTSLSKDTILQIMQSREYYGSVIGEGLTVGALLLIFLIPKDGLIKRCKFKKFKLEKVPVLLLLIIGFSILSIVFVHLTQNHVSGYKKIEQGMASTGFTLLGGVSLVLIIPIFEEIIFRGAIFGTLKRHMPVIIALIVQGVIFSIMHGNIIQSIYTFPLGVILGLAFIYGDSILADIMCHMLFNLLGVIVLPIIAYFFYSTIIFTVVGVVFIIGAYIIYRNNKKTLFN